MNEKHIIWPNFEASAASTHIFAVFLCVILPWCDCFLYEKWFLLIFLEIYSFYLPIDMRSWAVANNINLTIKLSICTETQFTAKKIIERELHLQSIRLPV